MRNNLENRNCDADGFLETMGQTSLRGILRRECLGVKNAKYNMKRKPIGGKVLGKWICLFTEINRISFGGVFNC